MECIPGVLRRYLARLAARSERATAPDRFIQLYFNGFMRVHVYDTRTEPRHSGGPLHIAQLGDQPCSDAETHGHM